MSEYVRIKKAIDNEKQKKIQAETKIDALKEEIERLKDDIEKTIGVRPKTADELQDILVKQKTEIETEINKIKSILDKEGVLY